MRWGPCSGMGGGLFLSQRYLDEYIAAAGIAEDPDAPLFQTARDRISTPRMSRTWTRPPRTKSRRPRRKFSIGRRRRDQSPS